MKGLGAVGIFQGVWALGLGFWVLGLGFRGILVSRTFGVLFIVGLIIKKHDKHLGCVLGSPTEGFLHIRFKAKGIFFFFWREVGGGGVGGLGGGGLGGWVGGWFRAAKWYAFSRPLFVTADLALSFCDGFPSQKS